MEVVPTQSFILNAGFPGETTQVYCGKKKVYSSIKTELAEMWGRRLAMEIYNERNILSPKSFGLVNWSAIGDAAKGIPQGYRV